MELEDQSYKQDPDDMEKRILSLLSTRPLPVDTLCFVLEVPPHRMCKILRRLEKWGEIQRITNVKSNYWGPKRYRNLNEI
jgi:predicted Rossmann fold nucleotide-binding protein DprA/Smf involved in DNA uptake